MWQYVVWGLCGGLVVEALEFRAAIRQVGDWPWRKPGEPGPLPMAVSVLIRVLTGAVLAPVMASAGQIQGALGALCVGITAPLLIEQFARQGAIIPAKPGEPTSADRADPGDLDAGTAIDPGQR